MFGLRETIEASDEEENGENPIRVSAHSENIDQKCTASVVFPIPGAIQTQKLPSNVHDTLLEVYKQRIDVLFKVVHWPSLKTQLEASDQVKSAALLALDHAMLFLATCSIDQTFCDEQRLGHRESVIQHTRSATEHYLQEAQLLTTTNFTTLQAFVLYLMAIRCCGEAAATWSLLALAVRIADTCGVRPAEHNDNLPPFELEQRRRLWYSIGLLDSQVAFGRGSLPLLNRKDLSTAPLNVNDSEINVNMVEKPSSTSFTDMSFTHLCHGAMICQRKLADPHFAKWQDRLDIIAHFTDFAEQNFLQFEFSNEPIQRYVANCAKDMMSSMHLLLRRPPYKQNGNVVPVNEDFDVMGMACRVVQSGLFKAKHADFAPYRWWKWPKWYALAVLLVEILNARNGQVRDRAYDIAKESFQDYAQSASDANSALLWKPVVKLMRLVDSLMSKRQNVQTPESSGAYNSSMSDRSGPLDGPTSISTSMTSGTISQPESYSDISTPGIEWDEFLNNMDFSRPDDLDTLGFQQDLIMVDVV